MIGEYWSECMDAHADMRLQWSFNYLRRLKSKCTTGVCNLPAVAIWDSDQTTRIHRPSLHFAYLSYCTDVTLCYVSAGLRLEKLHKVGKYWWNCVNAHVELRLLSVWPFSDCSDQHAQPEFRICICMLRYPSGRVRLIKLLGWGGWAELLLVAHSGLQRIGSTSTVWGKWQWIALWLQKAHYTVVGEYFSYCMIVQADLCLIAAHS